MIAMERIEAINRDRIRWCCAQYGIPTAALASVAGIADATMERFLSGEIGLTFAQLRKIAGAFGRGTLFFLEPGPVDEEQVYTPQFRTIANERPDISAKLKTIIQRAEEQREVYLALTEDLDEEAPPHFSPPALPDKPAAAAQVVRKWLRLDAERSFNEYRTAVEDRDVLVFRSNGYAGKWQFPVDSLVLGLALSYEIFPVILVRKRPAEAQQTFTLFHELSHLLLFQSSSIDDEKDMFAAHGRERRANDLAGRILVPDKLLGLVDDAARPHDAWHYPAWVSAVKQMTGTSTEVVLRRLLDAGRLAQEDYQAYRQWARGRPQRQDEGGSRVYRHREPRHIFGDQFVRTVLEAKNAQRITLARAARYLDGLKLKDMRLLEQFYAHV